MITHSVRISFCLFLLLVCGHTAAAYDPLALPADASGRICDLTARDEARSRDLPLRVYLPRGSDAAPVVLFSHGLGGTCQGSAFLGKHWSARGYVAVFMQHPGSDDSVWKEEPRAKRMAAMEQAASGKQFFDRVRDVPAVLKQLDVWNKQAGHALSGRVDLTRVGMSGHSFGAVTTQAVSGQSAAVIGQRFTDQRIRAAIAFSPSSPRRGDPATAFGSVRHSLDADDRHEGHGADRRSNGRIAFGRLSALAGEDRQVRIGAAQCRAFGLYRAELCRVTANSGIRITTAPSWPSPPPSGTPTCASDDAARGWLHGTEARSVLESKDGWQFHSAQQRE